ncbi:MAG: CorA family divalent cation transporter [Candidatus Micrarchaeota archaeon]|nr:CorA family divalent cation transporter [Candidatus Micrarchaeota archaeon]
MANGAKSKFNGEKRCSQNIILALEERGFCATLSKDRKTARLESRLLSDFLPAIRRSSIAWVDYVVDDFDRDAAKCASQLGFSELLVKNLLKNQRSGYEDLEKEMGILLPAIIVDGFEVKLHPLLILLNNKIIVTLHTSEAKRFFRVRRYAETLLHKLPKSAPQKDKMTHLLIRLIDENNARNFDHLREIEEHGDSLSQHLSDPKTPREKLSPLIYQMKHALIVYLGGLWATVDALNSLRYGDAELLTDEPRLIGRIGALVNEVNIHIGLAEHLSEVLASGLEVLQSIYNNQLQILNNRLALLVGWLTIIGTALLVPNTIATIASSAAFDLGPEDRDWYLALLALSTVLAILLAWWTVKKMGLLPSKPDSD